MTIARLELEDWEALDLETKTVEFVAMQDRAVVLDTHATSLLNDVRLDPRLRVEVEKALAAVAAI